MRTVILSEEAYHDCCCTVAVQTISLPTTHRLRPLVASLEPRWDRRFYAIAHTGYAWACSQVCASVLSALLSLVHCSPCTAQYSRYSSALLYELLYSHKLRARPHVSASYGHGCCGHQHCARSSTGRAAQPSSSVALPGVPVPV